MIEYVFGEKLKKIDAQVLCIDKNKKEISTFIKNNFSKDELQVIEKAIKENKKESMEKFILSGRKIVVLFWDYKKTEHDLQKLGAKIGKNISEFSNVEVYVEDFNDKSKNILIGLELSFYRFNKYFTDKKKLEELNLKKVSIFGFNKSLKADEILEVESVSSSVNFVRDLVNEPANILNSEEFEKRCKNLKIKGLKIKVLEEKELNKLGFNLLLSVNKASANKPKVMIMTWDGDASKKTYDVALVGKGVTFDTGGLSLKGSQYMENMNTDMAGAAVVCGAMKSIAELKLNKNVIGIVGLVENSVSAEATRVNDIIVSMSGQTVEVMNTDAEGRLVLADLITYVQKEYKATKIIDLATLTGAVSRLFGPVYAGLFSNDKKLTEKLLDSGEVSGDRLWELPLDEYFDEAMNSDVADMRNSGKHPVGGGSQGACFLKRFINEGVSWAHLDIAGVARETTDKELNPKGATGYGVKLLLEYISK